MLDSATPGDWLGECGESPDLSDPTMLFDLPVPHLLGLIQNRVWFRGEYLLWATKGACTPPLLTTSTPNTPEGQAGVLGQPHTEILLGNQKMNRGLHRADA